MNSHNITNESLALALMLRWWQSYSAIKKTGAEKDILSCRASDNSADYCYYAEVYFPRG